MKDLHELNASIIQERIKIAMSDFKLAYSHWSFFGTRKIADKYVFLSKSNNMLDCLLVKYSLTRRKLYDMMTRIENLKSAGVSGTFSLFELRNYLFGLIQRQIIHNMYMVLRDIEGRRKPATVCNGGCIQCDGTLPHWWPSARTHSREERASYWDASMGFYRIGFCSGKCVTAFNNSLRSDFRIEEPDNGILSPKTRYTCQYRSCKRQILWTDLERRGWFTFCCDSCENMECEERYEDDQMYAKYDRYLDRW
jgi:hypothetical protein